MYQIKQGHRVITRTTGLGLAHQRAAEASENSQLISITEVWEEDGEGHVADYFDGHQV